VGDGLVEEAQEVSALGGGEAGPDAGLGGVEGGLDAGACPGGDAGLEEEGAAVGGGGDAADQGLGLHAGDGAGELVIEAFLDGYHIRVLHRDSIHRFFLDAASIGEPVGRHIRAVSARRAMRGAPPGLDAVADLRELGTPSYVLFPGTVVIEHPDFVSLITLAPTAAALTDVDHLMLIPADRAGDADRWDRSWALIEDGVFQREDLWACEQIQRSIDAGAGDELLFGALEQPVRWFHAVIEAELAVATAAGTVAGTATDQSNAR
jgi:hypothetical protein